MIDIGVVCMLLFGSMRVFLQCVLAADFVQDEGDGCAEPRVFDELGNEGNRSDQWEQRYKCMA